MLYKKIIGNSVKRQKIICHSNFDLQRKPRKACTLIIGGMHGDEKAPIPILKKFITNYLKAKSNSKPVCIIPILNPDGYKANKRTNAHDIDLNRNFPYNWSKESEEFSGTTPLSEPESEALYNFLLEFQPAKVVNLHWALSEIDADGKQSASLAKKMWNSLSQNEKFYYQLKIQIKNTKGKKEYPGSLGQFCGYKLCYKSHKKPAMITLELPYTFETNKKLHPLSENSLATMESIWKKDSVKYLKIIGPPVYKLLEVACE